MNINKEILATPCRVVILNVLKDGPKVWRDLRVAYYGPVRSLSSSNTSFQNQTKRMTEKGLIKKEDGHYEITDAGRKLLEGLTPEEVEGAKSQAHHMAEVK